VTRSPDYLTHNQLLELEPDLEQLRTAYSRKNVDVNIAIQQLTALVKQGSVMAAIYLSDIYQTGSDRNDTKAEHWYRVAFECKALNAVYYLGTLLLRQERLEEAKNVLRIGVDYDDPASQYWLARALIKSDGLGEEAIQLLEYAAAHGHVRALNSIARIYISGDPAGNRFKGLKLFALSIWKAAEISAKDPNDRRLW
jgi:TPR repeat protein